MIATIVLTLIAMTAIANRMPMSCFRDSVHVPEVAGLESLNRARRAGVSIGSRNGELSPAPRAELDGEDSDLGWSWRDRDESVSGVYAGVGVGCEFVETTGVVAAVEAGCGAAPIGRAGSGDAVTGVRTSTFGAFGVTTGAGSRAGGCFTG